MPQGETIVDNLVTLIEGVTDPPIKRVYRKPPDMADAQRVTPCAFIWYESADGTIRQRSDDRKRWQYVFGLAVCVSSTEDGDIMASCDEMREKIENAFDGDRHLTATCERYDAGRWDFGYEAGAEEGGHIVVARTSVTAIKQIARQSN